MEEKAEKELGSFIQTLSSEGDVLASTIILPMDLQVQPFLPSNTHRGSTEPVRPLD